MCNYIGIVLFLIFIFYLLSSKSQNISKIPIQEIKPSDYVNNRLTGGKDATFKQYPFLISIRKNHQHKCVGTLLSPNWILTAALCLVSEIKLYLTLEDPLIYEVISGQTFLYTDKGQTRQPKRFFIHSKFDRETLLNNIGLIYVDSPFEMTNETQLDIKDFQDSNQCKVAGWSGSEFELVDYEPVDIQFKTFRLKDMHVEIFNFKACQSLLGRRLIRYHSLCVIIQNGCPGDLGAPLICGNKQHGLLSWNIGCSIKNYPVVFIRATYFLRWIKNVTNYDSVDSLVRSETLNIFNALHLVDLIFTVFLLFVIK